MARSRKFLAAGAVGVAAVALIAATSSVTGAYLTDSHPGTINASNGAVLVDTAGMTMNFDKLLPGDFKTEHVSYTARGSEAEDVWLVFPTDGSADRLNGAAGGNVPTGRADLALGRYGHIAVKDAAGTLLFRSYNLAANRIGDVSAPCFVDKFGVGGSDAQAATAGSAPADIIPYCPVPNAIRIGSSVAPGVNTTADITFGFTKLLKGPNVPNGPTGVVADFKIVATQVGILPSDPNNVH